MHLIHRPYRRMPKWEKLLAMTFFIVLVIIIMFSFATVLSEYKSQHQEKYYTIVLSEDEFFQLEKLYKTYHNEAPNSIQKVQNSNQEGIFPSLKFPASIQEVPKVMH
jgi:hypothetical protein